MPRRFRFAAVLALIVMAAFGLAACGDDDTPDAAGLLKDAFGPNHSVKSGNLAVKLALDAKGLKNVNGPVGLTLDGPFESQGKGKLPKVDLSLKLGGSGSTFSAGAITDGEHGWIEVQGTPFVADATTFAKFKENYEKSAAKNSGDGQGQTLKSLGVDPLRWLKDPALAGTEKLNGAETYRITAGIDVGAFLNDISTLLTKAGSLGGSAAGVPSGLSPAQRIAIAASVKDAALQIWVGKDDKTLRRVRLDLDIDVPQQIRAKANGLSTGKLTFDLAINDLNKPQTIVGPENARPLSDLKKLIAGQQVSQGGGSTSPQTPSTPSTTPPSTSTTPSSGSSQYLDCVAKAGSNIREVQKCAALAGQ